MQKHDEVKKGKYNSKEAYSRIIKDLTQKGCIITEDTPIIKTVKVPVLPNKEHIAKQFTSWLQKDTSAASLFPMGGLPMPELDTKFEIFKSEFPNLFKTQIKQEEFIEQLPFTINTSNAKLLGNGAWGKISFLVNYKGFTLISK